MNIPSIESLLSELDKVRRERDYFSAAAGEFEFAVINLTADRETLKAYYESVFEDGAKRIQKLTAERDAALKDAASANELLWSNEDDLIRIMHELQDTKSALREAKEALNEITDVFANIGMTSGIYDDEQESLKKACEAIATINKVLGEK